jgi:ketosteroid isomerase-like protein
MNRKAIRFNLQHTLKQISPFVLCLALSLALTSTAAAQKKKKKGTSDPAPATPLVNNLPDDQRIDYQISEMLGAWQLGDIEKLHKDISEDISVVNGVWGPPVTGWINYLAAYQMQRARIQQVRLERQNTLIRVLPGGTVAYACYQWEFSAMVDGAPSTALGQTTLIFEKRNDNWLIVHNHTSLAQPGPPQPQATPTPQAPAVPKP